MMCNIFVRSLLFRRGDGVLRVLGLQLIAVQREQRELLSRIPDFNLDLKVAGRDRRALWGAPSPDGQASETFEVDGARGRNARGKARGKGRRRQTRQQNPSKIQAIQRFLNSRATRPAIPGDALGRFLTRHVGKWSTPHLIRGTISTSPAPRPPARASRAAPWSCI